MKELAWSAGPGVLVVQDTARPKKDVGESEIVGAPGSQENNRNKILLLQLGKLPGKTGSSWFLNIFGKQERERGGFFPISPVLADEIPKKAPHPLPIEQTALASVRRSLGLFKKLRCFSLCFTLLLKWACITFIIGKKKTIYILKSWQHPPPRPTFKMVIWRHTLYHLPNAKILWNIPITSNRRWSICSRAGKQKRVPLTSQQVWEFPRTEADRSRETHQRASTGNAFLEGDLTFY